MDQSQTGIIECPGFDLGYRTEGSGPNALVIGSSIYYPRLFSQNLRKHLRLIFSDMRAFAPPPRLEAPMPFPLDVLLEDVERVRQILDLRKVIVIGHSGNAFLALEYAKKYPEHVSHVVMIGTGPDFSEESKKKADRYWEETASEERKEIFRKSFALHPDSQYEQVPAARRFIWNYLRHAAKIWCDPYFDSTFLWKEVQVNMSLFDFIWGTLFKQIDITKGLERLDKPVFLALGRYDYIVAPPDSWDPLRPQFKDLSLAVFEQSGHSPFYEESALFDQKLLDWLSIR